MNHYTRNDMPKMMPRATMPLGKKLLRRTSCSGCLKNEERETKRSGVHRSIKNLQEPHDMFKDIGIHEYDQSSHPRIRRLPGPGYEHDFSTVPARTDIENGDYSLWSLDNLINCNKAIPDGVTYDDEGLGFVEKHTAVTRSCSLRRAISAETHGNLPDRPHNNSATIVCNGNGGYRVSLGWAATATCGIREATQRHEESHITDWRRRYPNGCRNSDGTNKPDGTHVPTGGAGYAAFLRQSECTAYTGDVAYETALLRNATVACRPEIQRVLTSDENHRRSFCSR